jgi:predicted transcriptional regulator
MNTSLQEYGVRDVPDVEAASGVQRVELPEIDNANALLADEEIKLPPQIIEGVLHQSLKGVLGSNSKARKTWILLDATISVATGLPFWKWRTCKGRVLYINFEIPRAFIRSRIKCLCERRRISDLSNLDVWTLRGRGAALGSLLPALFAKIEAGKYVLIIIDPIYKGLGGRDENSAGDIGELCNELEQIAVETGAAVLYAAHFSKGNQAGKEAIDRIGGSGVWTRDADSIITLTKHQIEGAFTVDLILRNLPEQSPFVVKWNFPLMEVAPGLDPDELKQAVGRKREYDPRKLLAIIAKTTVEKPISISAWAAAGNIKRQTLTDYLPEMRVKGWIATAGEGNAARQYVTEKGREILQEEA